MADYLLKQYGTVTPWGEPVEPPFSETTESTGAAVALNPGAVYVKVVPTVDGYIKFGGSSVVATSADSKIIATFGTGAVVPPNGGVYVYVAV